MHMRSALIIATSLLGACQSQVGDPEVADASAARGEHVYAAHCATCHGDSGAGNEPWFPSLQRLAGLREPTEMVETVITGRFRRAGELNAHTIPIMPAWGQLSDADVAAIINYVQQTWGSGASITIDEVSRVRAELF
jgi:mono/diheme cytochrome c family protein